MKVRILTHEKLVDELDAVSITVMTTDGQITVLPGHIHLFAPLKTGELTIKTTDNQIYLMALSGGFIDVNTTEVRILADFARKADDVDELAMQKAIEDAKKAIEDAKDEQEFSFHQGEMERAMLSLETANKWRKLEKV